MSITWTLLGSAPGYPRCEAPGEWTDVLEYQTDGSRNRKATLDAMNAGGLLEHFGALGGGGIGHMPEVEKLQKEIAARSFGAQMSGQLLGILNNKSATPEQKAAATAMQRKVDSFVKIATSDKMLNILPPEPLRLAFGEEGGGGRFGGHAMAMKEQDWALEQQRWKEQMDAAVAEGGGSNVNTEIGALVKEVHELIQVLKPQAAGANRDDVPLSTILSP